MTPSRLRRCRQLGCRAEAGLHQLQREVGRRRHTATCSFIADYGAILLTVRTTRPAWTPAMVPATAEASAGRAGPAIVANVHIDAPAAPLSDFRSRWTPAVAPLDMTTNDICAHMASGYWVTGGSDDTISLPSAPPTGSVAFGAGTSASLAASLADRAHSRRLWALFDSHWQPPRFRLTWCRDCRRKVQPSGSLLLQ